MPSFNPGDIVQLNSGGPNMSIVNADEVTAGNYNCTWFAGTIVQQGSFGGLLLTLIQAAGTTVTPPTTGS